LLAVHDVPDVTACVVIQSLVNVCQLRMDLRQSNVQTKQSKILHFKIHKMFLSIVCANASEWCFCMPVTSGFWNMLNFIDTPMESKVTLQIFAMYHSCLSARCVCAIQQDHVTFAERKKRRSLSLEKCLLQLTLQTCLTLHLSESAMEC